MSYALLKRSILCAAGLGLLSTAAFAGGYGGSSGCSSPVASQEAQAILAYSEHYRDGNFRVRHTEAAGSEASTVSDGETAFGYGSSETNIKAGGGAISWKRSVQRSSGYATNGSASATGFSASFVKVRTGDGKYYIFKGMVNTGASVGPGGTSTSQQGLAKSAGGRY
jgi:hypothetical protein